MSEPQEPQHLTIPPSAVTHTEKSPSVFDQALAPIRARRAEIDAAIADRVKARAELNEGIKSLRAEAAEIDRFLRATVVHSRKPKAK